MMSKSTVLTILFLTHLIKANETTEVSDEILRKYNQKICDNSPTCDLIDQVPSDYRDLRRRNCMCDEQCSTYGDCCADSKYKNTIPIRDANTIACVSTYSSGDISTIVSCPATWNGTESYRRHCESNASHSKQPDNWLLIPVTNRRTRTTYKNVFCALCNDDTDIVFWNVEFAFQRLNDPTASATPVDLTPIQLYSNMTLNSSDSGSCKSYVNDTIYSCEMYGTLSVEDENNVRYCIADVIDTCININCSGYTAYAYYDRDVYKNNECAGCNGVLESRGCNVSTARAATASRRSLSPYILDVDQLPVQAEHCSEIPELFAAVKTLCGKAEATKITVQDTCEAPKNCKIDAFLWIGADVDVIDNETIYLKTWGIRYPIAEYLMLNDTYVYVCGHYIPRTPFQQFFSVLDDWVSETLVKFSLFFLVMHLIFFQQLPEMKNLSGKNLAAFCFTLLVALTCFEIGPWLPHCVFTAVVQHYAFMSCFAWMLIMSYDCWLSLYRATKKFRSSGGKKHAWRFALYCAFSWIAVPATVVGVALYFELTPASKIPCHMKPGYGKYEQCFISQRYAMYYFFFGPASCMFLGNIAFFVHTAVMIYLSQRRTVNPNTRNDFKLYTRLALMMGLTWTLGSITTLTDNVVIAFLFSVLNMSQGIVIFFAFTFKQKILRQLLNKHKNNSIISTTLSTFVCESSTDPASIKIQSEQNGENG